MPETKETTEPTAAPEEMVPIVIDLGKVRRKRIRQLKRGRGPLVEEAQEVVAELRASLERLEGKEVVPVVIVYREKPKRRKRRGFFPFF
jgi:hypothetical protein